ncbi:GerMN domain-containing protein [Evansella sp. AB-P1]|uniref:GerMN domain-containing protein n=1 Tax=Evansella sp. AB-P1 TaxID=3037653 RepID=UPI0024200A4A|nr:GerMN domain-containing protein [Evansella sp. AB-P1]MDG5786904.1 GerMN domain-containing protein [Evansella sp. AB-P1]
MRRLKGKLGWLLTIVTAITLTACGSDPVNDIDDVLKDIDPPQQIEYMEEDEEVSLEVMEDENGTIGDPATDLDADGITDQEEVEEKGGTVSESVMRELYLMDRNGLVAPQTLTIPTGENEVEKVVEYLVNGGPVTEVLPSGFQAVLPSGTEILGAEVSSDGIVTIDFSEEFSDYHPNQELQVLQALTWTVTQLSDVNRLMIKVEGEQLEMMPQNGTPIASGYTRAHGINLEMSDQTDLVNTNSVVLYFLSENEGRTYYVPVTRRVPAQEDVYQAVVGELLKGPSMLTALLSDFDSNVQLVEEPRFSNGTLTVNFSKELLNKNEGTALSEDVLNMLVLSLTEQENVENVSLLVDSEETIEVSTGETLSTPVNRPNTVNTGEY